MVPTCAFDESVVEDSVNRRASRLYRPRAGSHCLGILFAQAIVLFLVVVRDLRCLARREAHFTNLGCPCTRSGGLLLPAMLSSKRTTFGAAIDVVLVGSIVVRGRLNRRIVACACRRCARSVLYLRNRESVKGGANLAGYQWSFGASAFCSG